MKKKIIAVSILALVAFGAPSAALAYGGTPASQSSTNPAPGQTVTIQWPAGTFGDDEFPLTASVTCTNGTPVIVTVPAPTVLRAGTASSTPFVANADGSFTLQVQTPNENYGTCDCTVVGAITSATATATLTQLAADLPRTGFDATPVAWIGGTALSLGLLIAVGFAVRRRSVAKD